MHARRYAPLLSLLLFACEPHPAPPVPSPPTAPRTRLDDAPLPQGLDVSHEVMGFVVLSDAARVLGEVTPDAATPAGAQAVIAHALGVDPALGRVLDLRRPVGVAVLNPSLLASRTVQPLIGMIPIVSRTAVERALLAAHVPVQPTRWGFIMPTSAGRICVGFYRDYAVVAWRPDLLGAAVRVLVPPLRRHADAPIAVHLDVNNVYAAYGPQLRGVLEQFGRLAEQGGSEGDPQVAFALRSARNLVRYVDSVSDLELLANLDSGGLTLTLRMDGKHGGAWADFVGQQRPGPIWGSQFIPRDAVLAYATHASPIGRAEDIEAAISYISDLSPTQRTSEPEQARWRQALQRAAGVAGSDLVYAVWPGSSGGIGLGGAYRVTDPVAARAAVSGVYQALSHQLGGFVARSLQLDPARFASRIEVHQRSGSIQGLPVDLVEVSVRWPAGARAEKRVFETLFGKQLVLATAFVGQQALFAAGADYQRRLATMIGAAEGQPSASLADEPGFAEAVSFHPQARVSMSYLETGRMARFAAGLMMQASDMTDRDRAAMAALVEQVGRGAIISTTNASGGRYELTTHVPESAIVGVAQLNGALWRIALSPLINPPMMPPMPVPPPHVTPSVRSVGEGPTL